MKKSDYKIVSWHYRKTKEIPKNWDMVSLGRLCKVRKEGEVNSDLYVGLENIGQGNNQLETVENVADFTSTKNVFLKGDVLYGKLRPLLNKIWLAGKEGHCSTDILPLIPNDKILGRMLLFVILNHDFYWYAVGMSAGTKMPRVNWSDMKNFLVALPPKAEQQKIALALSNVDSLIGETQKKIEQTQILKKGLMQKLLVKGINHTKFKKVKLGLRFIEIEIPQEWKIVKLGEYLFDVKGGAPLEPEDFTLDGFPVLHKGDIKSDDVIEIGKTNPFCSNDFAKDHQSSIIDNTYLVVTLRDLVPSGPTIGLIAHCTGEYLLAQGAYGFHHDKSKIDSRFLIHLSNSYFYRKYVRSMSVGSTQIHIRTPEFLNLQLPIPPIDEQQKISVILSNLDYKIRKEQEFRTNFENLKKGLMQKLLTGQIRVKV